MAAFRKFLTRKITRTNLEHFLKKHRSSSYTLDLGCSASAYAEYFPNRVGLDIEKRKRVDVVGDAHALPFEDNTFDTILCTEVLEHLHSPHIAVSEMRRVLKPNGELILTTRFLFPIHDAPDDYFRYTKYGLEYLFKEWEVIEIKEETESLGAIAVLLQTLANQSEWKGGRATKVFVLLCAQLLYRLPRLTKVELGNGRQARRREEKTVLASGYYIVCKNKK